MDEPQMVRVTFGLDLMGYRPGDTIDVVDTPDLRRLAASGAISIRPIPTDESRR